MTPSSRARKSPALPPLVAGVIATVASLLCVCVTVDDRLYACADTAPRCPEGFECAADGLCHPEASSGEEDGGDVDAGSADAGDSGPPGDGGFCSTLAQPCGGPSAGCCSGLFCDGVACRVEGDFCARARPRPLPLGSATVSFLGTTADAADHATSACGGDGGADVFYLFAVQGSVDIRVTRHDGGIAPTIWLTDDCRKDELLCAAAPTDGGSRTVLSTSNLPPAGYRLAVDTPPGTSGDFTVEITASNGLKTSDVCELPRTAGPFDAGVVEFANILSTAVTGLDRHNPCDAGVVDVVYRFEVQSPGPLKFEAFPAPGLDVAVGLASGPDCDSLVSLGCVNMSGTGAGETLNALVQPGAYYLFWSSDVAKNVEGRLTIPQ